MLKLVGVSKYYIGPIGDPSLLTATAAAAHVHSLHWVIEIKFQKWRCCVTQQRQTQQRHFWNFISMTQCKLCFVVKKTVIWYKNTTANTDSHRISDNSIKASYPAVTTELKMTIGHIISVQRVHWRSIPSRRLWQSTKTGCRWGRRADGADVVFTYTRN